MKDAAVFASSGAPATFACAIPNVMDVKERGSDVKLVVEGDATKLSFPQNETKPFADVHRRRRDSGLGDRVCRARATRNGVVPVVIEQNPKLGDDMAGYIEQGCEVLTL